MKRYIRVNDSTVAQLDEECNGVICSIAYYNQSELIIQYIAYNLPVRIKKVILLTPRTKKLTWRFCKKYL